MEPRLFNPDIIEPQALGKVKEKIVTRILSRFCNIFSRQSPPGLYLPQHQRPAWLAAKP
jgi:hypothetical protein